MSEQLKLDCYRAAGNMREARELYEWLTEATVSQEVPPSPTPEQLASALMQMNKFDSFVSNPNTAALSPAPAPQAVYEGEIPEGFTKWPPTPTFPLGTMLEYWWSDGKLHISPADKDWTEPADAYRIISQPADQSEAKSLEALRALKADPAYQAEMAAAREVLKETLIPDATADQSKEEIGRKPLPHPCTCHPDDAPPECQYRYALTDCLAAYEKMLPYPNPDETHTDDLRTAEGEPWTPPTEDELRRIGEAEDAVDATLAGSVLDDPDFQARVEAAREQEAAYVGLQDPELERDYDAMREREKADKPKLHFSIFGSRKLEEV